MKKTQKSKPTETFLASKSALARHLNIGRQALAKYLDLDGAPTKSPKGWPAAKVKAWVFRNADRTDILGRLDPEMRAIREWLIFERTRALRLKNDVADGLLVRVDFHEADIRRRASACQAVLNRMPSRMAVELPGLTVAEAQARLQLEINKALAALAEAAPGQ